MAKARLEPWDCALCFGRWTDPVTLGCKHCFCSACLRRHWGQSSTGNCPKCNRRWSKELPPDLSFKGRARSVRQWGTAQMGSMEMERSKSLTNLIEPPPRFRNLKVLPKASLRKETTEERTQKEQIQSQINSLKEQKAKLEGAKRAYEDMLKYTERQVLQCKTQIRAQFDWFHQFLRQEEELCLTSLREGQQLKARTLTQGLENMQCELNSLSYKIQSAEECLKLRLYSSDIKMAKVKPSPLLRPRLLIDQAKVLGNLAFRVWEKMGRLVQYSPVILDPNTANRWLRLSEDLTSVRQGDTVQQQVPLNTERFSNYPTVLGSEGFSSGTHQWDVEVGDHPSWAIGLAKESVYRVIDCSVNPQDGLWCLMLRNNEYTDVVGEAVKLEKRPEKIRVRVDLNRGWVFFYNAKDMTLICSYTDNFTGKMFPFFSVGRAGGANTKDIKICRTDAYFKVSASLG